MDRWLVCRVQLNGQMRTITVGATRRQGKSASTMPEGFASLDIDELAVLLCDGLPDARRRPGRASGAASAGAVRPGGGDLPRASAARDRERAAADLEAIRDAGVQQRARPARVGGQSSPLVARTDFDDAESRRWGSPASRACECRLRLDVAALPGVAACAGIRTDGSSPSRRQTRPSPPAPASTIRACAPTSRPLSPPQPPTPQRHAAWHAIDLGSDLPDGFCRCPHTERRFREWLTATFGSEPRPASSAASDRAAFVALQRADHLALLTAAASARGAHSASSSARAPSILRQLLDEPPGQDDWLMSTVVDHYGTVVPPETGSAAPLRLASRAAGARARRSALGDARQGLADDRRRCPRLGAADLRLLTWAALSRGARGVTYGDWRASATDAARAWSGVTGRSPTARARRARWRASSAATRRSSRRSVRARRRIAIVYDPRLPADGVAARSPTSIACSSSGTSRSISSISTRSPPAWRAATLVFADSAVDAARGRRPTR